MPLAPARPVDAGLAAHLAWAWRWFWFVFTKNRFFIAVASLVWLVWRSGSQPRRLGYPCQQAAAANLGFLAVLFVPALARRRRRRIGSSWPQIAELATGSIALAGVLFILVSEGAQVYSELTAAWTPGNPAVIAWTSVQPSSQAALSPRVISPSNLESIVSVNRDSKASYGVQPYGPASHSAYELVWESVADLHLGPHDNPMRDLVSDMDGDGLTEVFIKPNTVHYFGADSDGERSSVYVHPAMVRPLVDMAALAGAQQIFVGDGSDGTGAYFTSKMDPMGYTQAYFDQMRAEWPGVNIARVDLHNPRRWSWVNLGAQAGGASTYVGSGYTSSQLQKARDGSAGSYFAATDSHGRSGPGAANCMGWLAISDALLDADVIIDLAKLKVHYLAVNTAALKNWVGITMYSTYNTSNISACRLAHNVYGAVSYEMEFGNDILWREVVDAHRAVLYSRGQSIETTPQRRYLCILDAINCGERYHVPEKPLPYWLDTVLASVDPVAVDAVASRLQLYKFGRIPIVNNAHAVSIQSSRPLGTADPGHVRVVGNTGIDASYNHLFAWETAQDKGMTWPDWSATLLSDTTPPQIASWTRQDLGGSWQLNAQIADCYAAYFYYGDAGDGAPNVVRLARNGSTFSAILSGAACDGLLVAQDDQFNTVRALVTDRAVMELSDAAITRSALCRQALTASTFTVRNVGTAALNYTVQVDPDAASWLSASPVSGTSSGEADTVALNYNLAGLTPGTYTAQVTVTDPESFNVQETVTVSLTLSGYRADFDGDQDVDQEDYAHLQLCLTGDLNPQTLPACADARLDGDADVDSNDAALFTYCLSGSGVPAGPCCAP